MCKDIESFDEISGVFSGGTLNLASRACMTIKGRGNVSIMEDKR